MFFNLFLKIFLTLFSVSLMSACSTIKSTLFESGPSLKTFVYIPKPPELRIKDLQANAVTSPIQESEEIDRGKSEHAKNSSLTQNQSNDLQASKDSLLWPVKGKVVITFEEQMKQKKNMPGALAGIHILAYKNCPVKAALSGIVSYSGVWGPMKVVTIKSYPNIAIAYGYLCGELPKKGDRVSVGQIIGQVEGKNNRPVLYFAVRKDNVIVDPLKYLK